MIAVAEWEAIKGRVRKEMACAIVRARLAEVEVGAAIADGDVKNDVTKCIQGC